METLLVEVLCKILNFIRRSTYFNPFKLHMFSCIQILKSYIIYIHTLDSPKWPHKQCIVIIYTTRKLQGFI